VSVKDGGNQAFVITPDPGYMVLEVKVDGESIGAVELYTFIDVTKDHTIYAVFGLKPEQTSPPTPTPKPTPTPSGPPVTEGPTLPPEPTPTQTVEPTPTPPRVTLPPGV
jgi:hypothetical protein